MRLKRKDEYLIILSLTLAGFLIIGYKKIPYLVSLHWKTYDFLMSTKIKIQPPAAATKDVLLVLIDNKTLENTRQRWPYPRSDFAKVITRLMNAKPKVIAFDFAFFGLSAPQDDMVLVNTLNETDTKIILPSTINEDGTLNLPFLPGVTHELPSGIVTKIQDKDGIIRSDICYLINAEKRQQGFLSWGMEILTEVKSVNLSTIEAGKDYLYFEGTGDEEWSVPWNPKTNTYLINFRANTADFNHISFIDLLQGQFDPQMVKDKIIMIGFSSVLLGDIHNTSVGWLPGITINANAFLTLYAHDFINKFPGFVYIIVILLGVMAASWLTILFRKELLLILLLAEIVLFLAISCILLIFGYTWNYAVFILAVLLCPYLSKKAVYWEER